MSQLSIIISTIAILMLIKGFFLVLFPNFMKRIAMKFLKDKKTTMKLTFFYILIAIALYLISTRV